MLSDLLPLLATWFSIVFVEIKVPENKALSTAQKMSFSDAVVKVVQATGMTPKIVVISYDQEVLERLATWQEQGIVAGWDTSDDSSVSKARKWNMPWALMPVGAVNERIGAVARGLSQNVAVYQVDSPRLFLEAENAGARAIMSDSVRTICSMLGRLKKEPPMEPKP